jgi:hypothetical protein
VHAEQAPSLLLAVPAMQVPLVALLQQSPLGQRTLGEQFVQVPCAVVLVATHTCPLPQSVLLVIQVPVVASQHLPAPHDVDVHVVALVHDPPTHVCPEGHVTPQVPQLFESVCVFVQPVQQRVWLLVHVGTELVQEFSHLCWLLPMQLLVHWGLLSPTQFVSHWALLLPTQQCWHWGLLLPKQLYWQCGLLSPVQSCSQKMRLSPVQ